MDTPDPEPRFNALLAEHGDRIYRICCGYVRDPEDRNDVYQAVLVHLWQGLARFRGEASASTWVYRVTANTCLTHLRAERRRQRLTSDTEVVVEALHGAAPAGPAEAEAATVARLHACIQALPPVDRLLVSLYLEEAGAQQMAEVLGITAAHARVKLHRARRTLRAIWERTDHGTGRVQAESAPGEGPRH